jgi:hypothetical protein
MTTGQTMAVLLGLVMLVFMAGFVIVILLS